LACVSSERFYLSSRPAVHTPRRLDFLFLQLKRTWPSNMQPTHGLSPLVNQHEKERELEEGKVVIPILLAYSFPLLSGLCHSLVHGCWVKSVCLLNILPHSLLFVLTPPRGRATEWIPTSQTCNVYLALLPQPLAPCLFLTSFSLPLFRWKNQGSETKKICVSK
jgi:hypothetical protein